MWWTSCELLFIIIVYFYIISTIREYPKSKKKKITIQVPNNSRCKEPAEDWSVFSSGTFSWWHVKLIWQTKDDLFYLSKKWKHPNNGNSDRCSPVLLTTRAKHLLEKYLTLRKIRNPPRGFLLANMIKYAEGCRFVHIYQKNPQGITSLLTQCGSNNTQYEELSSLIFVPNFSSSYSKIYYLIF